MHGVKTVRLFLLWARQAGESTSSNLSNGSSCHGSNSRWIGKLADGTTLVLPHDEFNYVETTRLMLRVIPLVFSTGVFAMKGGRPPAATASRGTPEYGTNGSGGSFSRFS